MDVDVPVDETVDETVDTTVGETVGETAATALARLRALAEPVRWRIVGRLSREQLCVCHLVADLGLAQPLVSHHLRALREAGLVEGERFGSFTYYRLRPDALAELGDHLGDLAAAAPTAQQDRRPCC